MRLIDADRLIKLFTPYISKNRQIEYQPRQLQIDDIKNAPTAEAIPIEWIIKWTQKFFTDINGKKYYSGEGYDSVWDMLADWEKENGKD